MSEPTVTRWRESGVRPSAAQVRQDSLASTEPYLCAEAEPVTAPCPSPLRVCQWATVGSPSPSKLAMDAALAPRDARPSTVPMRVYLDDPLQPPSDVPMPASAFYWSRGRPVGLAGPRVQVAVDGPLRLSAPVPEPPPDLDRAVTHRIRPAQPRADGSFLLDPEGRDLGQTTAFYAAHQVITLAEQAMGRRVNWGRNGRLRVEPYAFANTSHWAINGVFQAGRASVTMGSLAAVVDGDLRPHSGKGTAYLAAVAQAARRELAALERRLAVTPRGSQRQAFELERARLHASLDRVELYQRFTATAESPRDLDAALEAEPLHLARAQASKVEFELVLFVAELLESMAPMTTELLETAKSRELVAHECAHAALMAIKPGLWNAMGQALWEAHGDLMATLTAFDDPSVIDGVLAETGADLRRSNRASRWGEQLAQVYARVSRRVDDDALVAQRDLTSAKRFGDLPGADRRALLLGHASPESFDRYGASLVVSATLYELFAERANARLRACAPRVGSAPCRAAVVAARDEVAALLHQALLFLPEEGGSLGDLVGALFEADRRSGSLLAPHLTPILVRRGLMDPSGTPPRPAGMRDLPRLTIESGASLGPAEYELVKDRLRPLGAGSFTLEEDVTDARGYRVLRFAWDAAEPTDPEALATLREEGRRAQAKYGEYILEALRLRASLVFDPAGHLVAMHPARWPASH